MREIQNSPINVSKKVLFGIVGIISFFVLMFVIGGLAEYGLRAVLNGSCSVTCMSTTRPTR